MHQVLCEHGWEMHNGRLRIIWNELPIAPDSILRQVACACKKSKCIRGRCVCNAHQMKCSELCSCKDCENCEIELDEMLPDVNVDSEEED